MAYKKNKYLAYEGVRKFDTDLGNKTVNRN